MVKHHLWKVIVAVILAATLFAPGVSATSTVFQSPPPVPPPNDNFANATLIPNLPFNATVDMTQASHETDEPQPCPWANATIWYMYTPTIDEAIKVTLSGYYDTNLAVYQSTGAGMAGLMSLNCVSWNNPANITFRAAAGVTYYIQVGKVNWDPGTAQLAVESVPPPTNDNFSDVAVISAPDFYQSMDASAATTEPGEPGSSCYSAPLQTIWYAYTPTENGIVTTHLWAYYTNETTLNVLRADNPGIGGLSSINCTTYDSTIQIPVSAGITYYFQAGTMRLTANVMQFYMSFVPTPANDNFADATQFSELPFNATLDNTSGATTEAGEPTPSCAYNGLSRTVWYAFTPATSGSVSANSSGTFATVLAAYRGNSLTGLTFLGCQNYGNMLTFHVDVGTTYYFQVSALYPWESGGYLQFHVDTTPPPSAGFYFNPSDPSVFDTVQFWDNSYDPAGMGFQLQAWDFGDSTTATGCCPTHRYSKDGDYTVKLTVTTLDGRTGSTTQTVPVKTHDVAITKFTAPQSASAGQTRQLVVGLNSKRYVEVVQVQVSKSVPGGWQWVGTLQQTVPVRPSNRTTDFSFSYTFTKDDAALGKVTFKAEATLTNARDALPADNVYSALPTKVSR